MSTKKEFTREQVKETVGEHAAVALFGPEVVPEKMYQLWYFWSNHTISPRITCSGLLPKSLDACINYVNSKLGTYIILPEDIEDITLDTMVRVRNRKTGYYYEFYKGDSERRYNYHCINTIKNGLPISYGQLFPLDQIPRLFRLADITAADVTIEVEVCDG